LLAGNENGMYGGGGGCGYYASASSSPYSTAGKGGDGIIIIEW
jgi:hypothetical protein